MLNLNFRVCFTLFQPLAPCPKNVEHQRGCVGDKEENNEGHEPSPNPRLSKMSIQAMQTKRKSSAMTSTVREENPAAVRKATKPTLEQVIE